MAVTSLLFCIPPSLYHNEVEGRHLQFPRLLGHLQVVTTESSKEADNVDTTKRLKWVAKYCSCLAKIDPLRLKKQLDLFIFFVGFIEIRIKYEVYAC